MHSKTQRDAFWDKVYDIALTNKGVLIVSADMGAPSLDKFRADLSSQYVDVGIAEQQAIAVAAGLALGGKKVFAYSIAPFITLRCYEQIRLELAAMNIPVTMVGVGAGMGYDDSGPTHHTVEDISVLRILPNIRVHNMTDSVMASAFAELSCNLDYPNYVRLDRKPLPVIYKEDHDFTTGLTVLVHGSDMYIIATGNMVHRALEVSEELRNHSVDVGVIDVYTLPVNEELFLDTIKDIKALFTLEEHTLPGGLGSAICEVLADNSMLIPIKRFGLNFSTGYCYKYGGRQHLQSLYGLNKDAIVKSILSSCAAQ